MPPFIVVLAGAIGGVAVTRFALRTIQRVNQELEEVRLSHLAERAEVRATLRRDPKTGAYRPG